MREDPIVIVSYARTPIGKFNGELKAFSACELGGQAIKATVTQSSLPTKEISEVIVGCVLPAGLGQAPARQAAFLGGLSEKTPATTVNKVCGSGMKALMLAYDALIAEPNRIIVAGGMESMSQAPYLLTKARTGYRLGHDHIYDHMMKDGLEDAYQSGKPMGHFAEQCVNDYGFSRAEQDTFAQLSFTRAQTAIKKKWFQAEITPLISRTKTGEKVIEQDEHPFSVDPAKMPGLKPIFAPEGTITAGTSSAIADGAAALLCMRLSVAERLNLIPVARLCGHFSSAKTPSQFTTAPIDATHGLLKKVKWQKEEVDLFEVNEAFAVVALAFIRDLNLDPAKVNIHGGALALGHPIGASGARILVTLIAALKQHGLKKGIATLCIGGGEATAVAVELMN